jgi:hypothetical protein
VVREKEQSGHRIRPSHRKKLPRAPSLRLQALTRQISEIDQILQFILSSSCRATCKPAGLAKGMHMLAAIIWTLAIGFSVGALLVTAAADMQSTHLTLSTLVASSIAACGIRDVFISAEQVSTHTGRAAIVTRYMGVLWAWSALVTVVTYGLVLVWDAWYMTFVLLVSGAGLCLFVNAILRREAKTVDGDVRLVGIVNIVARVQFVLACLAIGALIASGRMHTNILGSPGAWAGLNICLSTAAGFAVLNGFVIATCPERSATGSRAMQGTQPQT